jgi:hypothetical protein
MQKSIILKLLQLNKTKIDLKSYIRNNNLYK